MEITRLVICEECHQERIHAGHGLCRTCYSRQRRARINQGHAAAVAEGLRTPPPGTPPVDLLAMPLNEFIIHPLEDYIKREILKEKLIRSRTNVTNEEIEETKRENARYAQFIRGEGHLISYAAWLEREEQEPLQRDPAE